MKRLQILQKLLYEKFYVHEIPAVNLSKMYFLKKAKKTCKPNNRDLNRDWKIIKTNLMMKNKKKVPIWCIKALRILTGKKQPNNNNNNNNGLLATYFIGFNFIKCCHVTQVWFSLRPEFSLLNFCRLIPIIQFNLIRLWNLFQF